MKVLNFVFFFMFSVSGLGSAYAVQCKSILNSVAQKPRLMINPILINYPELKVAFDAVDLYSLKINVENENHGLIFDKPLEALKNFSEESIEQAIKELRVEKKKKEKEKSETLESSRQDNFANLVYTAELLARSGVKTELQHNLLDITKPFELKITGTHNKNSLLETTLKDLKDKFGTEVVLSAKLIHSKSIRGEALNNRIELSLKNVLKTRTHFADELSDTFHHEMLHIKHEHDPEFDFAAELVVLPHEKKKERLIGGDYKSAFYIDELEAWSEDALRKHYIRDRERSFHHSENGARAFYNIIKFQYENTMQTLKDHNYSSYLFKVKGSGFGIFDINKSGIILDMNMNPKYKEMTSSELEGIYIHHLKKLGALLKKREQTMYELSRIKRERRKEEREALSAVMSGDF